MVRVESSNTRRWLLTGLQLFAVLLVVRMTGCEPSGNSSVNAASDVASDVGTVLVSVVPVPDVSEQLPGGAGSTSLKPIPAFDKVVTNLPDSAKPDFYAGKALAEQAWIKAPTATDARDGLGPIYNARACLSCHIRGGRSRVPDESGAALFVGPLVRMSVVPGAVVGAGTQSYTRLIAGVIPDPVYGDQLQNQSVALLHQLGKANPQEIAAAADVPPEAVPHIQWTDSVYQYPDGRQVSLRAPQLQMQFEAYGPFDPDTRFSLRNAPVIGGTGLLERIPLAALQALEDVDDRDQNGISGRLNEVWDPVSQQWVAGRFGLKANRPNLDMVVASAFANDIGISNPLFPNQPCTAAQSACLVQVSGNNADGFELPQPLLQLVTDFTRQLGVPKRRNADDPSVLAGRRLFYQSGCAGCHHPDFVTTSSDHLPELGNQRIWPYTDLLLHDMGPGLADNRPDFAASGREWRTPPLWGVGLGQQINGSGQLLHDGRARSIEEAILWHGGEAEAVRQQFVSLAEAERQALLRFVQSL
jgi:CxxC motif-containing protein (DUF1111 family)